MPVPLWSRSSHSLISLSCVFALGAAAVAQAPAPPPVTFTTDQDRQNMMDQLGIKALRPGPSGNEKAPNHANSHTLPSPGSRAGNSGHLARFSRDVGYHRFRT